MLYVAANSILPPKLALQCNSDLKIVPSVKIFDAEGSHSRMRAFIVVLLGDHQINDGDLYQRGELSPINIGDALSRVFWPFNKCAKDVDTIENRHCLLLHLPYRIPFVSLSAFLWCQWPLKNAQNQL